MLQKLKLLVKDRGWKITTKKLTNGIINDGECITMFPEIDIPKRFRWYKIPISSKETRPLQVVWVEVAFGKENFFYIAEMELKSNEQGCSTLIFHKNDFKILTNDVFKNLLILTAIRRTWAASHHSWEKHPSFADKASNLFDTITAHHLSHPPTITVEKNDKEEKVLVSIEKWAEFFLEQFDERNILINIKT